jgi:hypothetical protein
VIQRLLDAIRRALAPPLEVRADPWLVITEVAIVGPRRRELRKRSHVRLNSSGNADVFAQFDWVPMEPPPDFVAEVRIALMLGSGVKETTTLTAVEWRRTHSVRFDVLLGETLRMGSLQPLDRLRGAA